MMYFLMYANCLYINLYSVFISLYSYIVVIHLWHPQKTRIFTPSLCPHASMWKWSPLCVMLLCYVMLLCNVLCCCAMLCWYFMCYVALQCVMFLCYVMSYVALLCYVAIQCVILLCNVLCCYVMCYINWYIMLLVMLICRKVLSYVMSLIMLLYFNCLCVNRSGTCWLGSTISVVPTSNRMPGITCRKVSRSVKPLWTL